MVKSRRDTAVATGVRPRQTDPNNYRISHAKGKPKDSPLGHVKLTPVMTPLRLEDILLIFSKDRERFIETRPGAAGTDTAITLSR